MPVFKALWQRLYPLVWSVNFGLLLTLQRLLGRGHSYFLRHFYKKLKGIFIQYIFSNCNFYENGYISITHIPVFKNVANLKIYTKHIYLLSSHQNQSL